MMPDMLLLSLTAALSWGLWRGMEAWGDMGMAWAVAWAWWMARTLREM
jgi:hypothetical protein